jgi:pimeloyl-ACP methyl ester carboxylesterase
VGIPLSPDNIDVPPLPSEDLLRSLERPALLLAGAADAFCPSDSLEDLGRRLPGSRVEIVQGADHFFRRREREAADIVARFADGAPARID